MDISSAIIAKSDQMNAIDLMGGPQIVTIADAFEGSREQPVVIVTSEFGKGRPFKPSKTALRVLGLAWGEHTSVWIGRRVELYRDPSVRWAGEEVGGIRIQGLSDIDGPLTFTLPTAKNKYAKLTVQQLPDLPPSRNWLTELAITDGDLDLIRALGTAAKNGKASADVMGKITTAYRAAEAAGKSVEAAAEEGAE